MKYFEFIVALATCALSVLWFKNSPPYDFRYEQVIVFIGGLIPLFDSLRRFGIFSKVNLSAQNPKISPWSFSGGKVNKTAISVELKLENNKETDLQVNSIAVQASETITDAIGSSQKIRLVNIEKNQNDAHLPISIPAKSPMTILVESEHDASHLEKYNQASKIGNLRQSEVLKLVVTYSIGSKKNTVFIDFAVNTSTLLDCVRSKYEESGDYKGVVKLIEKM